MEKKLSANFLFYSITFSFLKSVLAVEDYNIVYNDNSFEFGYDTPDSFHVGRGNRNNIVQGEFGGRNPSTGQIDGIQYTAGPRGYRPRGKNVVRKYDLNQNGPRAPGNKDDPYFDPTEDPSYNFGFKTRTYQRQEVSNNVGDVSGKFSYVDDVGERHNVDFVAGKNTGYHVKTPFPDSNPRAYGPLFFKGKGKPIPRGRTSIQRQLDGSYRFVSSGPDQRRTETSDSTGHVRGSYTYIDDKGVQHTVHYIAGPETGYRVLKTVKGPHLPDVFPFGSPEYTPPSIYDYSDDVFTTSESGRIKPSGIQGSHRQLKAEKGGKESSNGVNSSEQSGYDSESTNNDIGFDDIFGNNDFSKKQAQSPLSSQSSSLSRISPSKSPPSSSSYSSSSFSHSSSKSTDPAGGVEDDGSYKPSKDDDGSYKEDDGSYKHEKDYDQGDCCTPGNSGVDVQITEGKEGAIVTNLGKKILSVPPGVSVRAHVQAIDLIPLRPKVLSPSEQFKVEAGGRREESDQFGAE